MLVLKNLSYKVSGKSIISSLNASFERGGVNAIYGMNGVGKTTLFNCIYGFLKFEGEVLLDGKAICKNDVSYMLTESYFYPNLLGYEYLSIFENKNIPELFDINKLAELLGVPILENIDTYSTGMKKKLAFLAVIKLNRTVYLFDEPFNGVDSESILIMNNIIKLLVDSSKIVIITSHLKNHLTEIADMFLIMGKESNRQIPKNNFMESLQEFTSDISQKIQDTLLKSNE